MTITRRSLSDAVRATSKICDAGADRYSRLAPTRSDPPLGHDDAPVRDGTEAGGVHDVAEFDHTTPITVVASYEDGVFVLRPVGIPGIEVTRRLDADGHMVWTRPDGGGLVVTLERIGDGAGTPPNPFRLR